MEDASDVSEFGAPEYLPKTKVYVDLLQPESMSRAQLLEVFSRRGFSSMVSSEDAFHRLVDLYYDHVMPMPQSAEQSVNASSPPEHLNGERRKSMLSSGIKETKQSSLPHMKKFPETRLEDLVITSDPRRFTPGYSISETDRAERVLTVRKPQGLNSDTQNTRMRETDSVPRSNKRIDSHSMSVRSNQIPRTTPDSEPIPKKRVKLKRDFTNLV